MTNYKVFATSKKNETGIVQAQNSTYKFSIQTSQDQNLALPVDLLLGALAACILKNVERFSRMLKFNYSHCEISILGERIDVPASITAIQYELVIHNSDEKLNIKLLKRNLEKYGTVYNTLAKSCQITGDINIET